MDEIEKIAKESGLDFRLLDPENFIRMADTMLFLHRPSVQGNCYNVAWANKMQKIFKTT